MQFKNFVSSPSYLLRIICIPILMILNLIGIATITGFIDYAFAIPTIRDSNLQVQTIVSSGLDSPTSMAFLGPNDILVVEKNTGMVKRVKNGAVLSPALLDVKVASNSERGMLGIDVLRVTSSFYYVFLYYTEAQSRDGGAAAGNKLYRYIFNPAQGMLTSPQLLLHLPVKPGPNHDGGKVTIGPDGHVYTVLGDLNRQTKTQNFENGGNPDGTSGILRVTRDGNTVGAGIIGSTHPSNKYYGYAVRNSFGIDFDPVTGRLWDTENGPGSNDEINLVRSGFNSGWRDIMGMAPPGFNFNNLVTFDGKGRYSNPEFVWTQPVAPTAIEFLSSNALGTVYQNDMFVGDFNQGRIYRFDLNSLRTDLVLAGVLADKIANTDSETGSIIFGEGFRGVTDLKVGAGDGFLYVLSIGDEAIYRIVPSTAASFQENPDQEAVRRGEASESTLELDRQGDSVPNNINGDGKNEETCKKLDNRINQIQEQQDRGGLNEKQAIELRLRIKSMQNNLGC